MEKENAYDRLMYLMDVAPWIEESATFVYRRYVAGAPHYECSCDDTPDTQADPCPRRSLHRAEANGERTLRVMRDDPWVRLGDGDLPLPDAVYRAARTAAHFALMYLAGVREPWDLPHWTPPAPGECYSDVERPYEFAHPDGTCAFCGKPLSRTYVPFWHGCECGDAKPSQPITRSEAIYQAAGSGETAAEAMRGEFPRFGPD
jgi:hypothetical protein